MSSSAGAAGCCSAVTTHLVHTNHTQEVDADDEGMAEDGGAAAGADDAAPMEA